MGQPPDREPAARLPPLANDVIRPARGVLAAGARGAQDRLPSLAVQACAPPPTPPPSQDHIVPQSPILSTHWHHTNGITSPIPACHAVLTPKRHLPGLRRILEVPNGNPDAVRWLPNAAMNIAESCVNGRYGRERVTGLQCPYQCAERSGARSSPADSPDRSRRYATQGPRRARRGVGQRRQPARHPLHQLWAASSGHLPCDGLPPRPGHPARCAATPSGQSGEAACRCSGAQWQPAHRSVAARGSQARRWPSACR